MKKKNEKDFILYMKKIEDRVKEVMAELLDSSSDTPQDPLNLDASFLELGINSVLAVEVVEELNKQLGIELGVEVMFDYKDVKELAAFISRQYGKEYLSDDARISETIDSSKQTPVDRKSTRLNSSHRCISYAVF